VNEGGGYRLGHTTDADESPQPPLRFVLAAAK
jgi:hypothetical protein